MNVVACHHHQKLWGFTIFLTFFFGVRFRYDTLPYRTLLNIHPHPLLRIMTPITERKKTLTLAKKLEIVKFAYPEGLI